MKKSAGAGRGFVNPQRLDESDEDYITPKQRYDMEKEVEEKKKSEASESAFNKSRTTMRKGGYVRAADGIAQRGKTRGKLV
jgi:hypothetical protein